MKTMTSMSTKVATLAVTFAVVGLQLEALDAMARYRTVAPEMPVVQLERVVVTGQRTA